MIPVVRSSVLRSTQAARRATLNGRLVASSTVGTPYGRRHQSSAPTSSQGSVGTHLAAGLAGGAFVLGGSKWTELYT